MTVTLKILEPRIFKISIPQSGSMFAQTLRHGRKVGGRGKRKDIPGRGNLLGKVWRCTRVWNLLGTGFGPGLTLNVPGDTELIMAHCLPQRT